MTDKQDLYQEAMKFAKEKASISYVQRKCRCSYNDAERMLEQMVSDGVISTYNGRKGGEAIGAGGVSGPLVGSASLSANAGEPRKVFLVATGEEHEGEATYTRYDDKPPPLCDSECLFAAPPTAQAEGWRPISTAPRDGREVLAYTAGLGRVVVYFDDEESQWGTGLGYLHYDEPTHWTPLPPPPTSAERVEHG